MRWVILAAGLLLLFAVWRSGWIGNALPAMSRRPDLDVLLVTIDTLRADALGAYGYPGDITPWIDRLAAGGVRFTNAHAHNVITLPSHANILSGQLPSRHGVHDNAGFRFPQNLDTLATRLKSAGYRTGAFVSAFPLESRFGLAQGFDIYDDRFADAARPAFLIQQRSGPDTVARAQRWLASQTGQRWFCWVHIYEPHFPYSPPEPFASRFAGRPYYGEVSAADAALAPLLEPILAAGRDGRTLVILTADHGEALGDHGEATHGVFAYEPVLKVPLVIYQPRVAAPAIVDAPVGHVDLLPTVLDLLGLPQPTGLDGHSLLPVLSGSRGADTADRVTYFEALSASLNRRWAPLDGIIQHGMKYVELPIPELYDLQNDPREQHNLASLRSANVERMRAQVRQRRTEPAGITRNPETTDTRERLKSLGYVASNPGPIPSRWTEDDDPKRLIAYDARLQEIVGLYYDGDLPNALARCRELAVERPEMPLVLIHLAHLERESGNLDRGIDALTKAVALVPDNTESIALLGAYLTQAGRAAEAVGRLEAYARRNPPDVEVLRALALALARVGRSNYALATLGRARKEDPSNAMLLTDAGTVQLMASDRTGARESFEAAVALNPETPRAHSSLGVLALEERRTAEALEHWKAAIALDPRELDTVLGLGMSLARSHRTDEARVAIDFFVSHAPVRAYAQQIDRARALLVQLDKTANQASSPGR